MVTGSENLHEHYCSKCDLSCSWCCTLQIPIIIIISDFQDLLFSYQLYEYLQCMPAHVYKQAICC